MSGHYKYPTHLTTQICKRLRKRFAMRAIIEQFKDFNTHCCPKIRLRGWQKASHCTLVLFYVYASHINTTSSLSKLRCYMFLVTTNSQHISLHRSVNVFTSGLQMRAIIERFTDFNTHCCPKIRLRGWQKASHCTLVVFFKVLVAILNFCKTKKL